jgi:O-acetylhomoserine/O-acetylserine sulfhydrylase
MKTSSLDLNYLYNYSENISDLLYDSINDKEILNTDYSSDTKTINPKITFLEQRLLALEKGVSILSLKSFDDAKFLLFNNLLKSGDNIVSYNSWKVFYEDFAKLNKIGVKVHLSGDGSLETFKTLVNSSTRLIYLETISKEFLNIPDFKKIIAFAREKEIPVVVDNTAGAAGYLTEPIAWGADLVIENTDRWLPSISKYIGAVIIDAGSYNWHNGKFTQFNRSRFRYYDAGSGKYVDNKKGIPVNFSLVNYLKRKGNSSIHNHEVPTNPFSLINELESFSRIVQKQSENAKELAQWLQEKHFSSKVNYTGLPDHKSYFTALTYFKNGFGNFIEVLLDARHGSAKQYFSNYINESNPTGTSFTVNHINNSVSIIVGDESFLSIKDFIVENFKRFEYEKQSESLVI